jgi:glycyl-tRNA synthetase beta chain
MSEVRDFLLEIGTEELPPISSINLSHSLQEIFVANLKNAGLTFIENETKSFLAPRRLGIFIKSLSSAQESQEIEQKGPSLKIAFNEDGSPTQAALGFAKSCNIAVEKLEQKTFGKETKLVCKIIKSGESWQTLLPKIVSETLKKLPLPKAMRWGSSDFSFVRPVHWLLMLYGTDIVSAEIFGKTSSNKTYGHRYHHPEEIIITNANEYENTLEKWGYVIPNFVKRKNLVKQKIQEVVIDSGTPLIPEELLDEVTNLVEWPIAFIGKFSDKFLNLPPEVLTLVMEKQQKYFPLLDDNDQVLAKFIIVSNIDSRNPESVISGNENVLLARLTDAEFFYDIDAKFSLDSYRNKLNEIVFQTGLGTLDEKTVRIKKIATLIAEKLGANVLHVNRAAELAKADLQSTMVLEFPELQGITGYYYALHQNEPKEVAIAIKEHYLPRFAKDELPQTIAGSIIAIADRIDTLVGVFALKKLPTGEKDPFALRRAALGIFRIVLEKNLNLNLKELFSFAMQSYRMQLENFDELILKNYQIPSEDVDETADDVASEIVELLLTFMFERLRGIFMADEKTSMNDFNAVLAKRPANPLDFRKRLDAVLYFKTLPEAEVLSSLQKRVNNILQKAKEESLWQEKNCEEKLLHEAAEKDLFLCTKKTGAVVNALYANGDYQNIMINLAYLKPVINNFFDHVMVMIDDKKIRANRLALLNELQKLLTCVANIELIVAI